MAKKRKAAKKKAAPKKRKAAKNITKFSPNSHK